MILKEKSHKNVIKLAIYLGNPGCISPSRAATSPQSGQRLARNLDWNLLRIDILIRISQAPIPDALANEDVARLSAGGTLVGAESLSVGDEDELDQPAMDTS